MPESFEIARGLGDAGFQLTSGAALKAMPMPIFEFTLSEERETENLVSYQSGKHQNKFLLDTTSSYTLTISTQVPTWQTIGAARGELYRDLPGSTSCLRTLYKEIPSGGVVSVPGLLAANIATTAVTIEEGGGIELSVVNTVPADATEVQIEDGQLTFDGSREGETAFIAYFVTPTSGRILGGPTGASPRQTISKYNFAGEVWDSSSNGSNGYIWIPNAQLSTPPDVSFTGDAVTVELGLEVLSQTGWAEPYMIGYDMVWPT